MRKCKRLLLSLVFLAVPSLCAGQDSSRIPYREREAVALAPITSFGSITAFVRGVGLHNPPGTTQLEWERNEIGLHTDELTSFLRLRFKNNFANIPYIKDDNWEEKKNMAQLRCVIWTAGDSYPVAYHVECFLETGTTDCRSVLFDHSLGAGPKDRVIKTIHEEMDRMVSEFALRFFRARGEL